MLAKENPQYRGKGGLTKRAMQRLTVGALIAIRMHSKGVNVQQLRHVVLLMSLVTVSIIPSFVNIVHNLRVPELLRVTRLHMMITAPQLTEINQHQWWIRYHVLCQQRWRMSRHLKWRQQHVADIVHLSSLPDDLFCKVMACGDRLVMLAPRLISNLTSNLAECYMDLRTICDGGKQYNRIQSGSFQHGCYTVGLQAQHGPQWKVKFWEETMREPASQVYM